VAEKDCILQGLCHLSEHGGFITPGNPIIASVNMKAIKETPCIRYTFVKVHNFKQNYGMVNKKYSPKFLHTQMSSYFIAFRNDASFCCVPK